MELLLGHSVQGYVLSSLLGKGGMGEVYLAEHPVIKKKIAIKRLHPKQARPEKDLKRFFQEAQVVNEIHHENLVDVFNLIHEEDTGDAYILMEYLQGETLAAMIQREGPFSPRRIGHIGLQLCSALYAAHQKGIIHRDLKPENIFLITRAGQKDFVKILDFGLAKLYQEESALTKSGVIVGTPSYMPPEQANGEGIDPRSDLYSLGVVLFEMATGTIPLRGANLYELLGKLFSVVPPKARELNPQLSEALSDLIAACLAKKKEERPPDALFLAKELAALTSLDPMPYLGQALATARSPEKASEESPLVQGALSKTRSLSMELPRPEASKSRAALFGALALGAASFGLVVFFLWPSTTPPLAAPRVASAPVSAPSSALVVEAQTPPQSQPVSAPAETPKEPPKEAKPPPKEKKKVPAGEAKTTQDPSTKAPDEPFHPLVKPTNPPEDKDAFAPLKKPKP